jgi:hypothetical protein
MTFETENTLGGAGTAKAAPAPQATSQHEQRVANSLFAYSAFDEAPIEANIGGEALTKFTEKWKLLVKEKVSANFDIRLIPLDNNNVDEVRFSCLIVAMTLPRSAGKLVAFHTLILEATSAPIESLYETAGNRQIEIFRPADAAYDVDLIRLVKASVQREYPNHRLVNAEATVVPKRFVIDDATAFHNLATSVLYACSNEIKVNSAEFKGNDVNLGLIAGGVQLNVKQEFTKQQREDATGQPIRADVVVAMTNQVEGADSNKNRQINSANKSRLFSEIAGFVDLVYAPVVEQSASPYGFLPQQNNPQALIRYAARLVLTEIFTGKFTTLASQLLAIASSATLRDNNAWFSAFFNRGGSNLHDIGNVGYEVALDPTKPAGYIDTKGANWGPGDLGLLLTAVVRPGLIVSLDAPDAGPSTWSTNVFAGAANGHAPSVQLIVDAADRLTNGAFRSIFPANAPVFSQLLDRVHNGYYSGENGEIRDIRDIDYLAVLGATATTRPETIKEFSNTFMQKNVPLKERLYDRKNIITQLVPSAVITGMSTRVTFSEQFIQALVTACSAAGLRHTVKNQFSATDFNQQRASAQIDGALLGANFVNPSIQQFGPNQGQGGVGGSYGNKYL